jgi:Putative lumazine-binding
MARTATLVAIVLTTIVLAGCGDDYGGGDTSRSEPGTAQRDVRRVVEDYLAGLAEGRAEPVCRSLSEQGRKALTSFLPSDQESLPCAQAAKRVARRSAPLRRPRVEGISVSGTRATARVRSTKPAYDSGVLLTRVNGAWLIAFPPGLVEELSGAPGVPIHSDEPGN